MRPAGEGGPEVGSRPEAVVARDREPIDRVAEVPGHLILAVLHDDNLGPGKIASHRADRHPKPGPRAMTHEHHADLLRSFPAHAAPMVFAMLAD